MANVLIRNLPEETHKELQRRAERAGQSLQQYLVAELSRLAQRPTVDDVLDRVEQVAGGSFGLSDAVAAIDDERHRR